MVYISYNHEDVMRRYKLELDKVANVTYIVSTR